MNVQIITSSYPVIPGDPQGTAGLFVREFALELLRQGHSVVVHPVARTKSYCGDDGLTIRPLPWRGGDRELASMNFLNPLNWFIFLHFFFLGTVEAVRSHRRYKIDKVLCMWVVPSGIFGFWIRKMLDKPYDVWALGSDIWKIRKIPFIGNWLLRAVIRGADGVWADGLKLAVDVKQIAGKECRFLPSSRRLPQPRQGLDPLVPTDKKHIIFVGRFHENKGPDLLLEAMRLLPEEVKRRVVLHVYGAGGLKNVLHEMVERLGLRDIVRLNGPIDAQELADYLSRVDFLVIPSRIESIPVIFSDALQMGVPVVAMPVGDLPRLIHELQCGIVARRPDAQALSEAIVSAVDSTQHRDQAYQLMFKERFDIKNIVEKWIKTKDG